MDIFKRFKMYKKLKIFILCACLILSSCSARSSGSKSGDLSVVAVNFPAYDFARAVCGAENVHMLLPPGGDSHSYEPTARDILRIEQCDLFIYTGGESDVWVDRVLDSLDSDINTIKMTDIVPLISTHEHESGQETQEEYDEHVWTSPKNAALIVNAVKDALCDNASYSDIQRYEENARVYISKINELDSGFRELFDNAQNKTLIFGDRFPLIYFAEEYGLEYHAAFPGCAEHSEPGASDIAELIEIIRNQNVSVIYCIEFSDRNIAYSLKDACEEYNPGSPVAVRTFYTCHNISAEQMEAGETYVSLMTENLNMLREYIY